MTKIEAIESTLRDLEYDTYYYDWGSEDSCNCGLLAKTVLHGRLPSSFGLVMYFSEQYSPFASALTCMKTGLNMNTVGQVLAQTGFSFEEIICLENLSDFKIAQRAGLKLLPESEGMKYESCISRDEKESLIKYLKAWVAILKEEQEQNKPAEAQEGKTEIREIIRYVSVPETIKEQSKELILQ